MPEKIQIVLHKKFLDSGDFTFSHFSSLRFAILFFCSREAVDLGFAYDRRDSVMVVICKVLCLKLRQVLPFALTLALTFGLTLILPKSL